MNKKELYERFELIYRDVYGRGSKTEELFKDLFHFFSIDDLEDFYAYIKKEKELTEEQIDQMY